MSNDLESPTTTHTDANRKDFPFVAVLILTFASFISVTTELAPAGLLTQIAPDLNVGVAPAGMMTAAYALGIVLTVLPLTRLTLRMKRRLVLIVAVLAFVASNIVVALSPSLAAALAGRFIGGASHGLLWAVMPPIIGRLTSPARARQAMALVFGGTSLGLAAGAPLSSLIGNALGWRSAFIVIAASGLILAILVFLAIPDIQATNEQSVPLADAVRLPGVMRISIAWALLLLGHFTVFTYISPYVELLGVGGQITSLALFLLGIAGVAGVTLAGRTPRNALLSGLVGAPALIALTFLLLVVLPPSVPLVIALLILWGAAFAAAVLYNQEAILIAGHKAPETATGVSVLVMQFGVAFGAAVGAVTVAGAGVERIPLTGLLFISASALLLLGARRVLAAARKEMTLP